MAKAKGGNKPKKANKQANSQSNQGGSWGRGRGKGGGGRGNNRNNGNGNGFGNHRGPGNNWSPGKQADVKRFLAHREQKIEVQKTRDSNKQLMDVLMPTIAASHAMNLVATGAATAGQADKLAKRFEDAQRKKLKVIQKEAEKKQMKKLKAKTGKSKKDKVKQLLSALLDDSDATADDSDDSVVMSSSSDSESEPEVEEPPTKPKAKKKTKKSKEVSLPEPDDTGDDEAPEEEMVPLSSIDDRLAKMQAKLAADFKKQTAKEVKLAVAAALRSAPLALTDKDSTPQARGRPKSAGASGRARGEPSRFVAGSINSINSK